MPSIYPASVRILLFSVKSNMINSVCLSRCQIFLWILEWCHKLWTCYSNISQLSQGSQTDYFQTFLLFSVKGDMIESVFLFRCHILLWSLEWYHTTSLIILFTTYKVGDLGLLSSAFCQRLLCGHVSGRISDSNISHFPKVVKPIIFRRF